MSRTPHSPRTAGWIRVPQLHVTRQWVRTHSAAAPAERARRLRLAVAGATSAVAACLRATAPGRFGAEDAAKEVGGWIMRTLDAKYAILLGRLVEVGSATRHEVARRADLPLALVNRLAGIAEDALAAALGAA